MIWDKILGLQGTGFSAGVPAISYDNYSWYDNNSIFGFSLMNSPMPIFPNFNCWDLPGFSFSWPPLGISSSNVGKSQPGSYGTPTTVSGVNYSVFGSAANEIKKLRPAFQQKLQKLWEYAKSKGWKITLTSGYRSIEQQQRLYNLKLAGKKKCAVAKPGKSRHNFGCAVDIRINGKSSGSELLELGRYAKTIGVEQGLSFGEQWHFQVPLST